MKEIGSIKEGEKEADFIEVELIACCETSGGVVKGGGITPLKIVGIHGTPCGYMSGVSAGDIVYLSRRMCDGEKGGKWILYEAQREDGRKHLLLFAEGMHGDKRDGLPVSIAGIMKIKF